MHCTRFLRYCAICAAVMCSNLSIANTYYVGPSYTLKTIAAGISTASSGDTILLEAGATFSGSGNYNISITYDITISRTGAGADPVIDLSSLGKLFNIGLNHRVNLSNLRIINSSESTILNYGFLKITDCTFSKNSSSNNGGAIWNARALTITGSTFSENSATNYGGAIYHYATDLASCTISCCRFAGNTAANGDALYNTSPSYYVITATNNWWGSNNPDFGSLLFGAITHDPYITMSTAAKPQVIGETGTITVEFASSGTTCTIPTAPIEFTMTDGIVTPTQTTVIDGMASASFIVSASSARVCAQVDGEQLCIDVGPIIVDLYGTYTNIQAAVNAADTSDAICLMVGQIFTGVGNFNVDLQNKNLAFASTNTLLQAQIDLNQLGRLFTVDSGYTVTMQNLDIANGKISGAGVFGAIIENNGNLVLSNCKFRDSTIDNVGYGGAISNTGNLTGLNCEFTDNYATRGGAIANYYILSLSDCTFSNNQAVAGGAIELYANSQVSVLGCTFNSNEVTHYGGAVYSQANADVLFSCNRFVNNVAGVSGPAVYNSTSYTVSFENNWWGTNSPSSSLFVGNVDYTPYLTMSTTAKRKALGETGTITVDFTNNGTCTIPDTTITFTATDGIVTPTQATVIDGTASASFVASNTLARICAQVDNEEECTDVGPIVVDLYGTYTNIQAAVDAANDGDTICITADQTFTGTGNFNIEITKNLTFDRIGTGANPIIDLNYQGRLFGIYPDCTVTMNNLEIRNGYVDGLGGVVLAEGNLNAIDCTFIGNTATSIGGALAVAGLNVTGCTFIGNSATNYSGGAIYAGNGIVSCSRFAGNTAPAGSAVTAEVTVTATNNWWGTNSPSSSLFSGNVIYDPYIIMSIDLTHPGSGPAIVTVSFTKNGSCTIPTAPITFSTTDGTVTPTQSSVIDGTATAAFVATNTTARVCAQVDSQTECVYSGPLIVDLYGTYTNIQAAVNAAQNGDTIYITADQIFTGTGNYEITLSKSLSFTRTGSGADPVIELSGHRLFSINSGYTVTINNLNIQNGSSSTYGGAIFNSGTLTITGCTFGGNYASTYGGAIFNDVDVLSVTGCTFSSNSASQGGAIFNNIGFLDITGCTFSSNSASQGGAIYNDSSNITAFFCSRFINNSASQGAAIYNRGSQIMAENNWWGTNTPNTSSLFGGPGAITYTPWITMLLSANPSTITPGGMSTINLTFSRTCIPAIPVAFSTTEGTLTSTLENTIDGIATSTLTASYSGLTFIVSATAGPDEENYSLTLTLTPSPINPGISILKKINNGSVSTQEPGIVVASESTMDISYLVTNTGNVTLAVEITDDQGYDITPSTTILTPDASITCTAQTNAPGINELHKNIGTATGTTALSTVVTASASAYATSIPANPYRFNFGCICSDTGEEHILIGSHNMPTLDSNTLDCWLFDEGPTATANLVSSLDIGSQIIMDSATYNTDAGMHIAVLTQTEAGDTAIVLVTYDGTATIRSTTALSSRSFKAQWFVSLSGTPYIVTDEQNGMSLYEVNLATYEMTLSSSVPNLGAGAPSAFLRWYPQGDSLYVIQGYNQTSVATYKVDLSIPEIQSGITTDISGEFAAINSCATCYGDLVLGGAGNEEEGLLTRCEIGLSGELTITQTASISDTTVVNYCERCCCNNNPILVGTDNGLYSLNATALDIVASNSSMTNNVWINTCWCCDVTGDYCLAVNSDHETFVFQQADPTLNMVLELPN